MKRPLVGVLGFACAVFAAVSAVVWAGATPSAHAQEEPADVVDAFVDAVNAQDGAAAAALFTEDGVFADIDNASFAAVGNPAIVFVFEDFASLEISVELTNVQTNVDTGVVTGVARISDVDTEAAGVDRILQDFTIAVNDAGEITSATFITDSDDSQTRTYLEFFEEQDGEDDGDGEPFPGTAIALGPGRDGSQTGTAFISSAFGEESLTFVAIDIQPGAAGVLQPAHLHDGDCPGVGAIASPLASVLDGSSASIISMPEDDVLAGDFAINVHLSEAQFATYVSCGEVGAAAAEPTAVATPSAGTPAPPVATATRPSGIGAPDTGGGPGGGSGSTWLFGALAALGAMLAAGGLAAARERATRR